MAEKELLLDIPLEHEMNILGQMDQNLNKIQKQFQVSIIDRDGLLKIIGEEDAANKAKEVLLSLLKLSQKGNAITEITKHQQFTVNVPEKDLTKESEIAGFNSRKDKFALTGLSYTIGETVDAPLVDQCPVSIECQVLDMVECGALTNVIARVTRRVVDEELIDENDAFRSDRFSPISYMGDGDGRLYRYFSDESVKMGSIIKEIRKQEEK